METASLDLRAAPGGDWSAASNVHALPSPQPRQRARSTARVGDEEVVSGPEFRRELEREKRRAERSQRALSLTVLRVPSEDDAGSLVAELLAESDVRPNESSNGHGEIAPAIVVTQVHAGLEQAPRLPARTP